MYAALEEEKIYSAHISRGTGERLLVARDALASSVARHEACGSDFYGLASGVQRDLSDALKSVHNFGIRANACNIFFFRCVFDAIRIYIENNSDTWMMRTAFFDLVQAFAKLSGRIIIRGRVRGGVEFSR